MVFTKGHKAFKGTEKTRFKKGKSPWNKGLKGFMAGDKNPCWKGGLPKCKCGKTLSSRTSKYCNKCKGKIISEKMIGKNRGVHNSKNTEFKKGCISSRKDKKFPEFSGVNHPRWKGGCILQKAIRSLLEMKIWCREVFKRDNYTCKKCGKRGGKLEAHHKKEFCKILKDNNIKSIEDAINCEELWDINNGETMCLKCHDKIKHHWNNK